MRTPDRLSADLTGPRPHRSPWSCYLTSSATVDQIKAELRHLAGSKYVARTAVEF